jgi:hypothetical protein
MKNLFWLASFLFLTGSLVADPIDLKAPKVWQNGVLPKGDYVVIGVFPRFGNILVKTDARTENRHVVCLAVSVPTANLVKGDKWRPDPKEIYTLQAPVTAAQRSAFLQALNGNDWGAGQKVEWSEMTMFHAAPGRWGAAAYEEVSEPRRGLLIKDWEEEVKRVSKTVFTSLERAQIEYWKAMNTPKPPRFFNEAEAATKLAEYRASLGIAATNSGAKANIIRAQESIRQAQAEMQRLSQLQRNDPPYFGTNPFEGRWKLVNEKGVVSSFLTVTKSRGPNGILDFEAKRDHVPNSVCKLDIVGNEARLAWSDGFKDVLRSEGGRITFLGLGSGKTTGWDSPPQIRLHAVRIEGK